MILTPSASLKRPEAGSSKSLTPQRKHRKLLKDGSGTEVWPEAIEKVFVQGLREYWRSPFATYSRGRSRYRNQFLVEHLAKSGITRTKKQVASHIQVLRNMWKGEPEFHLVAGGEELYAEPGSMPSTKLDDNMDLIPFDFDDYDSTNTSDYSPPGPVKYEFPSSPTSLSHHFTPDSASSHSLPSLQSSPQMMVSQMDQQQQQYSLGMSPYTLSQLASSPSNRVTGFYLHSEGMPPFSVDFDSRVPPSSMPGPSWPMTMKTKLYLPSFDNNPQGFLASITLASTFSTGTCTTQVFHDQTRVHRETGPLHTSPANHGQSGPVSAFLPDSPLARCRPYFNLASGVTTTLTQQITIDSKTLLYAVHVLIRGDGGAAPTARLVGCQPQQDNSRRGTVSSSGSPQLEPASLATAYTTPHHTASYSSSSSPLYQPSTAPVSLSRSYATTTSPAYSLTSSPDATSLDHYSYSPSLSSTTTGANLAYTYSGTSALPALSHPYTQPPSVYGTTNMYGSLPESTVAPSPYRRTSLSHGLAGSSHPIY